MFNNHRKSFLSSLSGITLTSLSKDVLLYST
jgi:hypothetical protein